MMEWCWKIVKFSFKRQSKNHLMLSFFILQSKITKWNCTRQADYSRAPIDWFVKLIRRRTNFFFLPLNGFFSMKIHLYVQIILSAIETVKILYVKQLLRKLLLVFKILFFLTKLTTCPQFKFTWMNVAWWWQLLGIL